MKRVFIGILVTGWVAMLPGLGAEPVFEDTFDGRLKEGWSWIREDPAGWRVQDGELQIRAQPGNMWGPANNARNVLVRSVPRADSGSVTVTARVENHPTEQYEQIDLVWYYGDGHMVKIGQELVDGQLSIVMGREENDRTRTLAIIPLKEHRVDLRLTADGEQIRGYYRTTEGDGW